MNTMRDIPKSLSAAFGVFDCELVRSGEANIVPVYRRTFDAYPSGINARTRQMY